MELVEVSVQGFGPFQKAVTVQLAGPPGLVFVAGRNEVEPRLGPNGAGKTKLFEAIYWCLYGKSSKNLKAGSVANWFTELPCIVDVTFDQGLTIRRRWSKGQMNQLSLILDGEVTEVDQARVDELVGLNETEFLFSHYFAQGASFFIDLTPSDQLELFSYVLGIDLWERLADKAAKKSREAEQRLQQAQLARERAVANLREKEAKLEEYEEQEALEIRGKYRRALAVHRKIRGMQMPKPASLKRYEELKKLDKEATSAVANAKLREREAKRELEKLDDWVKLVKDFCPTCRQAVPKSHVTTEAARLRKTWATQLEDAQEELGDLVEQLDEIASLLGEEEEILSERDKALREKEKLEAELCSIIGEPNRFTALVGRAFDEAQDAGLRYVEDAKGVYQAGEDLEALKFWAKGFKDLRLFVVEESLAQLEFEVNSELQLLGLEEWRVSFDVEKETKTGGVRRGFSALVFAPELEAPVDFKSYSGGESQRVKLAVAAGVANLILQNKGIAGKTELWDEPTNGLGPEGIDDLLKRFSERAVQQGKRVFLADHRSLHFGGFVGKMTVVKTEEGSHVEVA